MDIAVISQRIKEDCHYFDSMLELIPAGKSSKLYDYNLSFILCIYIYNEYSILLYSRS